MADAGSPSLRPTVTVLALIASTSPLELAFFGDATASVPAVSGTSDSLSVGDQVTVQVRSRGRRPIVIGKVS